jgi:hypothetical protein
MSALGQKPTCAPQKVMSALPPIATAKADICASSCPLYPRKRTCAVQLGMSALGQKRTLLALFDHLVGPREQRWRHSETDRFGRFEIDYQLVLRRCLHRKVCRLFAL